MDKNNKESTPLVGEEEPRAAAGTAAVGTGTGLEESIAEAEESTTTDGKKENNADDADDPATATETATETETETAEMELKEQEPSKWMTVSRVLHEEDQEDQEDHVETEKEKEKEEKEKKAEKELHKSKSSSSSNNKKNKNAATDATTSDTLDAEADADSINAIPIPGPPEQIQRRNARDLRTQQPGAFPVSPSRTATATAASHRTRTTTYGSSSSSSSSPPDMEVAVGEIVNSNVGNTASTTAATEGNPSTLDADAATAHCVTATATTTANSTANANPWNNNDYDNHNDNEEETSNAETEMEAAIALAIEAVPVPVAVTVEDDQDDEERLSRLRATIEEEVRQRFLQEAVQATVVGNTHGHARSNRRMASSFSTSASFSKEFSLLDLQPQEQQEEEEEGQSQRSPSTSNHNRDLEAQHPQRQRQRQPQRQVSNKKRRAKSTSQPDQNENSCKTLLKNRTTLTLLVLGLVAIVIALAVGLGVGLSSHSKDNDNDNEKYNGYDDDDSEALLDTNSSQNMSTLELVRQRGYIRCGITQFGFANFVEPGQTNSIVSSSSTDKNNDNDNDNDNSVLLEGFNVEQCKAMALMALGDSSKHEQVFVDHFTRFSYLANGSIDIMTEGATFTMERNVWEPNFQSGFTFTVPYYYSGLAFAGKPMYVDCANAFESFYEHCRLMKICAIEGSSHIRILDTLVAGSVIVPYNGSDALLQHLEAETCNVVAGEPLFLAKVKDTFANKTNRTIDVSEWKMGDKFVSKEPLALVTRNDDSEWSTLANMMVNAFFVAEANNITKDNAYEMEQLFDDDDVANRSVVGHDANKNSNNKPPLASLFVSLIKEFGNYGELYENHIEQQIPRDKALNRPYDKYQSSGLLYSIPFGNLLVQGPEPLSRNKTTLMGRIYQRGYLICGVPTFRGTSFAARKSPNGDLMTTTTEQDSSSNATVPSLIDDQQEGDGSWSGFDVEFCRGLAAAFFEGDRTKVVFTGLTSMRQAYDDLSAMNVDVVAGARLSLQADYQEPVSRTGYTFSAPYYYDNDTRDAFAFMTRDGDEIWSSFVYWVVMATVYAEESNITASISADMPVVTLFGERLKQMFRDCVAAIGSYADVYERNLQDTIPRAGANRLNAGLSGAQMFPIPPI